MRHRTWCYDKDVTTMQGLQPSILLAVALAWTATVEAQVSEPFPPGGFEPAPIAYAEHGEYHATLLSEGGMAREPVTIYVPGASYIKVHFSEFSVPPGVVVEVRNPSGSEVYRYTHSNIHSHLRANFHSYSHTHKNTNSHTITHAQRRR